MKTEINEKVFIDLLEWKRLYDEELQRVISVLQHWKNTRFWGLK